VIISSHCIQTAPPPLTPFMERARELQAEGRDLIVLAQAVVDYAPPETFTEAIADGIRRASTKDGLPLHLYAPDAGTADLRTALSGYLSEAFEIPADPDTGIMVTPGANHAAYMALSALLEPGDEALLVTPWYFNHEMVVNLLGGQVRTVAAKHENGFVPRIDEILDSWSPRLKVLILVTPNNPTGACYSDEWIKELATALSSDSRWSDVWVLADQTYQEIYFGSKRPLSIGSLESMRGRTITVSSFSKSLALAGWRLGFMTAPPQLISELLKIQDSSVICASHAAQWALAQTLADRRVVDEYFSASREILRARRDALLGPLLSDGRFTLAVPDGACFAFVGLGAGISSETFAWDLLEASGVALVPGTHFGGDGDNFVRLSFGSGSESRLQEAAARIIKFATQMDNA